jgi:hypothetical protein
MDDLAAGGSRRDAGAGQDGRVSVAMGGVRYAVVSEDANSCLIRAPNGVPMRGLVDIFDGERHRAHCLVVFVQSEGAFVRVIYKRRTPTRETAPADYADEEGQAPDGHAPAGWAVDEAPASRAAGAGAGLMARLRAVGRTPHGGSG